MVFKDVPTKYKSSVKKTELTYIKVTCKSISGSDVKEEIPKFTGEESAESFLQTIKTIKTLARRCKWFESSTEKGIELSFETTNRSLMNDPLEKWKEEIDDLRSNQINKAGYDRCLAAFTKEVVGKNAYEKQLEYMKNTRKPHEMNCTEMFK